MVAPGHDEGRQRPRDKATYSGATRVAMVVEVRSSPGPRLVRTLASPVALPRRVVARGSKLRHPVALPPLPRRLAAFVALSPRCRPGRRAQQPRLPLATSRKWYRGTLVSYLGSRVLAVAVRCARRGARRANAAGAQDPSGNQGPTRAGCIDALFTAAAARGGDPPALEFSTRVVTRRRCSRQLEKPDFGQRAAAVTGAPRHLSPRRCRRCAKVCMPYGGRGRAARRVGVVWEISGCKGAAGKNREGAANAASY